VPEHDLQPLRLANRDRGMLFLQTAENNDAGILATPPTRDVSRTKSMTVPIACAQLACTTFDPCANLDKADQFVREAAKLGARMILLPEFLTSGCTYDNRMHDFAEAIGGPTTRWMRQLSSQRKCWIGAGIVERADGCVYDTFLLTGPAGE